MISSEPTASLACLTQCKGNCWNEGPDRLCQVTQGLPGSGTCSCHLSWAVCIQPSSCLASTYFVRSSSAKSKHWHEVPIIKFHRTTVLEVHHCPRAWPVCLPSLPFLTESQGGVKAPAFVIYAQCNERQGRDQGHMDWEIKPYAAYWLLCNSFSSLQAYLTGVTMEISGTAQEFYFSLQHHSPLTPKFKNEN